MPAPVNSVAPAITGTASVGFSLVTDVGTWSNTPTSYAFQWQRIDAVTSLAADIAGATQSVYVVSALDIGDTLRVIVTATNGDGSASANSAATAAVADTWFIVEDGSGLADAVSYASIDDANEYHARRANTSWSTLTEDEKRAALVKATDFIEYTYSTRFKGDRASQAQALSWPRSGVFLYGFEIGLDEIPVSLVNAVCELALRTIDNPELVVDESGQIKTETVGPISVTYMDGARQQKSYATVTRYLAPLLNGNGAIPVARA